MVEYLKLATECFKNRFTLTYLLNSGVGAERTKCLRL